jgi:hypothetical protein
VSNLQGARDLEKEKCFQSSDLENEKSEKHFFTLNEK